MKFVEPEKDHQGYYLQCKKKDQVKITAYEKKNITHLVLPTKVRDIFIDFRSSRFLNNKCAALAHNKRIALVIFQGDTCSANHAFQRIVGNMHRQFDFLAEPFVKSFQQCTTACKV